MKIKLLFLLFLLVSFSSFGQYVVVPHYVAKNGLIAYYPFNGNANDESGNQNHATVNGATLTTDKDDNLNSAYSFDGINSYIETNIANYPLKGESRSITGWFKATTPVVSKELDFCLLNYGNILDPDYWFKISFYRKGYLDLQFDSKTAQSQENYFNNKWTFFALTFDSVTNTYSLYINNVYKMGGSASLYTKGFGNLFRIGRNKLNNYFEGSIDDIGIWNRVLSIKEMSDLFTKTNKNPPPPTGITNIPDINFEKKLISIGLDFGNPDGQVPTSQISNLTNLNIASSSISDLTGIQEFKALQTLNISNNQLTNLDITNNLALNSLDCSSNQLKSIDVSKNIALANLDCHSNQLTSLDVALNVALNSLSCYSNQLTSLDTAKNIALNTLYCYSNQLTSLDVSKNIALEYLGCGSNQLTNLNLKNGENTSLNLSNNASSAFTNNPNLTCIEVDNVIYSNTNWSKSKDATAIYTTSCTAQQYTLIPDLNFEKKLIALGIDSGTTDGKVLTSNISSLTSLDVSSSSISNLTGIQDFVALTSLVCYSNSQLTSLDLSKNIALTSLDCSYNFRLTSLNLSQNIALTSLYCPTNQLINLDLSKNVALTSLNCSDNKLTSLDLSKNITLTYLDYSHNSKLNALNLSKNVALTSLNCSNNQLINLDLSNNIALTFLNCSKNKLTSLDLSKNIALTSLDCSYNSELNALDLSQNIALTSLDCSYNLGLISLDVSKSIALTSLDCSYNSGLNVLDLSKNIALTSLKSNGNSKLLTLDVSKNIALSELDCSYVNLTTLDVSKNTSLLALKCFNNQLTTLDVTKNSALKFLNCESNQLSAIDVSNNVSLDTLRCSSNKLIRLDVSKNVNLKRLFCSNNKLESLNLKNGNNSKFDVNNYSLGFSYNPDLTCIQVDDKTYSDANWSDFKDATASYSENCPPSSIIVSREFEDKLMALGIDKDGKNGSVLLADITNVTSIDVSNSGITNLSGIEYFTDLETLICKGNSLTTINLSSNTALKYLDCSNNPLTALDVSKNILLTELYFNGLVIKLNKNSNSKISNSASLTTLNLTNNLLLTKLDCSNNNLTSLDISKNTLLTDINCSNNSLQNLNVNNGNNTNMLNVNFKNNSTLSCIKVDDDVFSNANWTGAKDAAAIYSKTACTLGIEDVVTERITIYPNPVKGQLYIDNIVIEKIAVYDASGKLIKTTKFTNASDSNTIDLSNLTKGIYFIYLQSEGTSIARKIIVE